MWWNQHLVGWGLNYLILCPFLSFIWLPYLCWSWYMAEYISAGTAGCLIGMCRPQEAHRDVSSALGSGHRLYALERKPQGIQILSLDIFFGGKHVNTAAVAKLTGELPLIHFHYYHIQGCRESTADLIPINCQLLGILSRHGALERCGLVQQQFLLKVAVENNNLDHFNVLTLSEWTLLVEELGHPERAQSEATAPSCQDCLSVAIF